MSRSGDFINVNTAFTNSLYFTSNGRGERKGSSIIIDLLIKFMMIYLIGYVTCSFLWRVEADFKEG
ncbi:hypothetical protein FNE58_23165 [Bacillus thuringiensis]|uniref:Uncharacterized protein n=3 Tax=Bacillus thuringiensis TaxID=1428 RepID=A0A9W4A1L9_BACTO|nr:hypothetical protein HD73_6052 [Bacillus thuringiensis serovar kurstaki str. HD73]AGG04496.1 hypothetical protein H175_63p34 [Bacillus thuringiensis serovar thuringiensis str. IS5056]AIM34375.1 hypothetical protein DF16_pBMB69orf00026 [Bacillus thuringiensis serovar kurstaki str. YBT-1520]KAB1346768.1 hypothetical protein FPG91_29620 [Bacillus thuringiensis]OPA37307.1 hypothetical protein BHL12_12320 [Bacillus cereus]OTY91628.1 hypothetical protein BK755_06040 [Bacillus thuringiensis serova